MPRISNTERKISANTTRSVDAILLGVMGNEADLISVTRGSDIFCTKNGVT